MATTITTVSNPRPVKIFAYLLVFIAVFFLIVAAASSNWAYSEGYREGLFERCVYAGSATPLPFGMPATAGCISVYDDSRSTTYICVTLVLVLIAFVTDLIGTVLTGLGLKSCHPSKKKLLYKFAILFLLVALVTIAAAVAIYPIYFQKDLASEGNNPTLDGGKVALAVLSEDTAADEVEDAVEETVDTSDSEIETAALEVETEAAEVENEEEEEEVAEVEAEKLIMKRQTDDQDELTPVANIRHFSYGYCYGMSCACLICIFIAVLIMIIDHGAEEIIYKEEEKEEEEK